MHRSPAIRGTVLGLAGFAALAAGRLPPDTKAYGSSGWYSVGTCLSGDSADAHPGVRASISTA